MAPTHHRKSRTTSASKKAAPISSSRLTLHISISGALLWLLTSCATIISHQPAPKDWPTLHVSIRYVGFLELQKRCYKYLSIWMKLAGGFAFQCAEIDFAQKTCTIYRPENETEGDEHEQEHCRGKDHVGETVLRDAWERYKATGSTRPAESSPSRMNFGEPPNAKHSLHALCTSGVLEQPASSSTASK